MNTKIWYPIQCLAAYPVSFKYPAGPNIRYLEGYLKEHLVSGPKFSYLDLDILFLSQPVEYPVCSQMTNQLISGPSLIVMSVNFPCTSMAAAAVSMVFILDGCALSDAHMRREIFNFTHPRHLCPSIAVVKSR